MKPVKTIEHEYWNTSLFYILKMIIVCHWIKGMVLKVDLIGKPDVLGSGKDPKYRRVEYWTNEPTHILRSKYDYKKAIKWYDSLLWAGVPVWMRLSNLEQFDIHVKDKNGKFIYSQDTSATLHDVMTSNATITFIKQMAKTVMSKMDIQTMVLMAIVGVGAVVGLHYLGIF